MRTISSRMLCLSTPKLWTDTFIWTDYEMKQAGFEHLPIREVLDNNGVEKFKRVNLAVAIENISDPDIFLSDKRFVESLPDIIVTTGIHPNHARRSSNYIQKAVF